MWFKYAAAGCVAGLVAFSSTCTNPIGGTDTGNPKVSGVLFNNDGTRAKNALVRFIPTDYNPRNGSPASFDSAFTNDTGMYSFDSLPTNFYNVLGNSNDGVSFQDSVVVVSTARTRVPSDTLKAPGSLQGVVRLQPGDDCRTVFIIVMGTTIWTMPVDSLGNFNLSNLAEGEYHVRVITTLDQYQPMDLVITVHSGKNTALSDTIMLKYTGIPIPTGLKLFYDTTLTIVRLSWNTADSTLVKGYNVYRRDVNINSLFERINQTLIAETMFNDSFIGESMIYEYKVCAIDNGDNTGRLSSGVQVMTLPIITVPPVILYESLSANVLQGTMAKLSVHVFGYGELTFEWYRDSVSQSTLISGASVNDFSIPTTHASDAGYYFCVVSNAYGADTSAAMRITVFESSIVPVITSQPGYVSIGQGTAATLTVIALGTQPFWYQWFKNSVSPANVLSDQTTATLSLTNVQFTDSGSYYCIVHNEYGADTSNPVQLNVYAGSVFFTTQPKPVTVYLSQTATMSVEASAFRPGYAWYKNTVSFESLVSGKTTSTLTITNVQFSDSGNYICVVSSNFGSAQSNPAKLTVTGRPLITVQPRDTTVFETLPWSISVTATGDGVLSYAWYKTGDVIVYGTNSTFSNSSAAFSDSGTYYCVVANSFGACTSNVVTVSVSSIRQIHNSIMLAGAFVDSAHVKLSVLRYASLVASTPDQLFPWSPDTVLICYQSTGYPVSVSENQIDIKITKTRLQTAGGDQFDTLITVPPIGYQYYYFKGSVKWMNTSIKDDSIPPLGDNTTGAAVLMCDTSNSLTLSVTGITATQVTLAWTNSTGVPYDSFRIWYSGSPIPDSIDPSWRIPYQVVDGKNSTTVVQNLETWMNYHFGIQGLRSGFWTRIPATAKTEAWVRPPS